MDCSEIEIGATEVGLLKLPYRGIPEVDSHTYSAYTSEFTRGDGLSVGLGKGTASWTWLVLSQHELDILLDFIPTGEASVSLYIKTYTDEGGDLSEMLATFSAVMHRPQDRNGKNIITGSKRPTYNEVNIRFTNLVEV